MLYWTGVPAIALCEILLSVLQEAPAILADLIMPTGGKTMMGVERGQDGVERGRNVAGEAVEVIGSGSAPQILSSLLADSRPPFSAWTCAS